MRECNLEGKRRGDLKLELIGLARREAKPNVAVLVQKSSSIHEILFLVLVEAAWKAAWKIHETWGGG